MQSLMTIRPLIMTDFKQWAPLWNQYNIFYGRHSLPAQITQTTWERFLNPAEPVYALVAEMDQQLLGFVHYLFHRSTIQINNTCYLQDLFTAQLARNQGIGRALIEAVYEAAAKAGSKRVYWQTQTTNKTARKLYDNVATCSDFIVYSHNL